MAQVVEALLIEKTFGEIEAWSGDAQQLSLAARVVEEINPLDFLLDLRPRQQLRNPYRGAPGVTGAGTRDLDQMVTSIILPISSVTRSMGLCSYTAMIRRVVLSGWIGGRFNPEGMGVSQGQPGSRQGSQLKCRGERIRSAGGARRRWSDTCTRFEDFRPSKTAARSGGC